MRKMISHITNADITYNKFNNPNFIKPSFIYTSAKNSYPLEAFAVTPVRDVNW